jgi:hypothetical protein
MQFLTGTMKLKNYETIGDNGESTDLFLRTINKKADT